MWIQTSGVLSGYGTGNGNYNKPTKEYYVNHDYSIEGRCNICKATHIGYVSELVQAGDLLNSKFERSECICNAGFVYWDTRSKYPVIFLRYTQQGDGSPLVLQGSYISKVMADESSRVYEEESNTLWLVNRSYVKPIRLIL